MTDKMNFIRFLFLFFFKVHVVGVEKIVEITDVLSAQ